MKQRIAFAWAGLLALAFLAAPLATAAEKKEICPVCRVHEGENEPEAVKATSVFQGKTYGFCSATCKTTFDEYPQAYLPPVLPRPVPAFSVQSLEGKEVASSAIASGKPVLIDFWATWCAPCVSAMPRLQKLHQRHAPKGFAVVGISIDEEKDTAKKFLAKRPVAYPVYLDATKTPAWSVFHVRSVPAAFLVDGQGRIVKQWLGKVDLAEVEREVAKLMG